MNLIDKVSTGISASVDLIVDKNRQLAQLNRLSAIIRNETEVINHAYIALGKQYFKILEGEAEETDMTQIREVIKFSEERLKKAQARYDYIKVYGVPSSSVDNVEMTVHAQETEETESVAEDQESAEEENADITIAVADETAEASGTEKNETDDEVASEE